MRDLTPSTNRYLRAFERHRAAAEEAWLLLGTFYPSGRPPRVPGMDTIIRLAWRIECGRTPAQAAAREYIYRWALVLRADPDNPGMIFGVPHLLGT